MYGVHDDSPQVRELQLAPVITLAHHATLGQAAAVLCDVNVPIVLIDGAVGCALDRDDVVRAVAAGAGPAAAAAEYGHEPVSVDASASLLDTITTMLRHDHDAVIVLDAKRRVVGALGYGIATRTLAAASRWIGALRVALHLERV